MKNILFIFFLAFTGTCFSQTGAGLSVGSSTATPPAGVITATVGYRVNNAATSGQYLRGNGTNFVPSAIQIGDLPTITTAKGGTGLTSIGSALQVLRVNAGGTALEFATPTSGTVTSVGMTMPDVLFNASVTNSPVTSSGTLTPTLKTQTANTVLAGPTSGAAATPTMRALVSDDLPTVPTGKGGTGLTALGTANQQLRVNSGATALEYFTPTTVTASAFTAAVTTSSSQDTVLNSGNGYGHFQRIGDIVTFTFRIEVGLGAGGVTNVFEFQPPIASNLTTASSSAIGVASLDQQGGTSNDLARQRCYVYADAAAESIKVAVDPPDAVGAYPANRFFLTVSGSYIIE